MLMIFSGWFKLCFLGSFPSLCWSIDKISFFFFYVRLIISLWQFNKMALVWGKPRQPPLGSEEVSLFFLKINSFNDKFVNMNVCQVTVHKFIWNNLISSTLKCFFFCCSFLFWSQTLPCIDPNAPIFGILHEWILFWLYAYVHLPLINLKSCWVCA